MLTQACGADDAPNVMIGCCCKVGAWFVYLLECEHVGNDSLMCGQDATRDYQQAPPA